MVKHERKILHLDLDAFFCAVEEGRDPGLRGLPFAVGGQPHQRGVVASCSYAARAYGVRSAMPMSQAVRLCPDLLIIPHHFDAYRETSRAVMRLLHDLTPLVEQLSIDEAFLDLTGRPESGEVLAEGLQARINAELALPCSLGVAGNKLVAKIANNLGKSQARARIGKGDSPFRHYPNTVTVVPAGGEAAFLAPLPIEELWGVGPKTAAELRKLGLTTVGALAAYPTAVLAKRFGKHGYDISRRARGQDERPVETESETKSISRETTFTKDEYEAEKLRRTLRFLADSVGRRTRKNGLHGTTVKIKLRWGDFTTITRQTTLPHPTDNDDVIYQAALSLFTAHWPPRTPVRLIGVGLSGFDHPHQLGLWDTPAQTAPNPLQSTLDHLRERFGDKAVRRGSDLLIDEDM